MNKTDEIRAKLAGAFNPRALEVLNESHQHQGHAGDDGSGESHFRVRLEDPVFADMSRVARHRAVHAALGADLMAQIHALALEISG
ncbi:BolA family protein [Aliiroseovarius subalbicans]|uniref:BolA family protein n=1 Tax=Aliiroseovarius subalbicans TaxID=2925840 RepID=UPI001F5ABCE9|nr:BolA family protein [Aliiroseovarius subalbicans]MCI2398615.1 BolA family transcriptional regulator [Aliiroseovarius subalbicans]